MHTTRFLLNLAGIYDKFGLGGRYDKVFTVPKFSNKVSNSQVGYRVSSLVAASDWWVR